MASNDTSDQEESASMISILLPENVEKIFSYLKFHHLYNCSKVSQSWNKIAHDVAWRGKKNEDKHCGSKCACFVLPIDFQRMEKIKQDWSYKNKRIINNISEIESAARLVTAGLIEELNYMKFAEVDIGDIPVNIMNNLAKVIKIEIYLKEVKGCHIKMFEDVKCDWLLLKRMSIDASNLTETICIRGRSVSLNKIGGDIRQLLDHIEPNSLRLTRLTLDENATRSLTQMLRDRVTDLVLYDVDLEYKVLTEYDGNGKCQYIYVDLMDCLPDIYLEMVKYFESLGGNNSRWKLKNGLTLNLRPRTRSMVLIRDDHPLGILEKKENELEELFEKLVKKEYELEELGELKEKIRKVKMEINLLCQSINK